MPSRQQRTNQRSSNLPKNDTSMAGMRRMTFGGVKSRGKLLCYEFWQDLSMCRQSVETGGSIPPCCNEDDNNNDNDEDIDFGLAYSNLMATRKQNRPTLLLPRDCIFREVLFPGAFPVVIYIWIYIYILWNVPRYRYISRLPTSPFSRQSLLSKSSSSDIVFDCPLHHETWY